MPGQIVLVLQGGGALGAYQAGVYQALHEAGIEPDWIVGTSIGAINASLIAGNARQDRLPKLKEFWSRVQREPDWDFGAPLGLADKWSYWRTVTRGIPGFFTPTPLAHVGDFYPLGPEHAGYYSTAPLEATLSELVDFDLINRGRLRLTVGAAHVRTSRMTYFDSRRYKLDVKHIMASGALPPAFPGARVDGELYWDGGILSNTPTEVGLDDDPRRDSLIFTVHLWNPIGGEPTTMAEVLNRQKDLQYSSRIASQITRHQQAHRLRHVINELAARLPEAERNRPEVRELVAYGCQTRMHVVQLLAPQLSQENHTKDVDFSPAGIKQRWEAGYAHTKAVLARQPWVGQFDPLSGVILHDGEEFRNLAAE
ncbi:patatin-like phospholipase family protein [Bradyrhizobium sp. CB1650]|uniref:patatin-like phospholipase family protein n=1 Tax=Bradyrhizobium sp. CB1650 TaxID=3039153 RepID=UPI00243547F5|nr:patatin-like phospholipase family protein [Bradyrhizobium sp. CB1650]WGD52410.1 patatin-like phospholipase family protein [Bradyrhizobium sp. CB1650]